MKGGEERRERKGKRSVPTNKNLRLNSLLQQYSYVRDKYELKYCTVQ